MDSAKYSTIDIGAYAVDGFMLTQVANHLIKIAHKHGASQCEFSLDIEIPHGPYGKITRKCADLSPLTDGQFSGDVSNFSFMVYGYAPYQGEHIHYSMTLELNPARGGFILASGPANLALEAFEFLRAIMDGAEKMANEPISITPEITKQVDAENSRLARLFHLDTARWIAPISLCVLLYAFAILGPLSYTIPAMLAAVVCAITAARSFNQVRPRRKKRLERSAEKAKLAGIPSPADPTKPKRSINLSKPAVDDRLTRLGYAPLMPLEV